MTKICRDLDEHNLDETWASTLCHVDVYRFEGCRLGQMGRKTYCCRASKAARFS